jgi:hypothetical protein
MFLLFLDVFRAVVHRKPPLLKICNLHTCVLIYTVHSSYLFLRSTHTKTLQAANTNSELVQAPEVTPRVHDQGDRSSRFIGDLNPEAVFLAATSPDATRGVSNDSIGVW